MLVLMMMRKLRDRHRENGRQHQTRDTSHIGIRECRARHPDAQAQAGTPQRSPLQAELQRAADQHGKRQRHDRLRQARREPQRAPDERQIEQHRRERGHGKALVGVEHTRRQCNQRHEQDVREHPARHDGRQFEGRRVARQTRRDQPDQHRRSDDAQDRHHQQHPEQRTGHMTGKCRGLRLVAAGADIGQHRHERLLEGSFAEQAAQQVRQAKRDIERVGFRARAEQARDQHVADQAGDA